MTTKVSLTGAAWVDLGVGPLSIQLLSVGAALIVVDTAAPGSLAADAQLLSPGTAPALVQFGTQSTHVYARAADATALVSISSMAASGSVKLSYALLTSAGATGAAASGIAGGNYVWRVEGTFGGATATLQVLGLDGTTWSAVKDTDGTTDITATAARTKAVAVAQGASLRVAISGGSGVSLNSVLAGY